MSSIKGNAQKFKYADHVAWRRIEDESIILDLDTSVYYSLNETGAFVWERLGDAEPVSRVVAELCKEFDVDAAAASRDVDEIVRQFRKLKLLLAG